jgi:PAS domain S-box-containing protein
MKIPNARLVRKATAPLVAAAVLACALILAWRNYGEVREHYLLIHSFCELFAVVVAFGIFLIVWNSRQFWENSFFLVLGMGCFFVAGLDLIHTLAYSGMGVLQTRGANLATQLWVAARYFQAGCFLAAILLAGRKFDPRAVFGALALVFSAVLASIFWWGVFPVCFKDPAGGLTVFKIYAEYGVSVLFALSGALLWARRDRFDNSAVMFLLGAIALTILSELAFTAYGDPYAWPNLAGHLLKVASFYLIYKAVIEASLTRPYGMLFRELSDRQDRLREAMEDSNRRRRENAALLSASKAVLEHQDFALATARILEGARRLTGAQAGYVSLLDDDGVSDELICVDAGGEGAAEWPHSAAPVGTLHEAVYQSRRVGCFNDLPRGTGRQPLPAVGVKLDNVMLSPILLDGRPAGLVALGNKPGGFLDGDTGAAASFAEFAAIALRDMRRRLSLELSEERFRAVAETASDAIVCFDSDGRIFLWNAAAERMFGYRQDEATGRQAETVFAEPAREQYRGGLLRSTAEGAAGMGAPIELAGLRADGSEFPAELSMASWTIDEQVYHTAIVRDVTRRKKIEEDLHKYQAELEQRVYDRTADLNRTVDELQIEVVERLRAEHALRASHDLLEAGYGHSEIGPLLEEFCERIKKLVDCDGVGIRVLEEGGRIPYRGAVGMPAEFLKLEGNLSLREHGCVCSHVVAGDVEKGTPGFTPFGSFYTEDIYAVRANPPRGEGWSPRFVCCDFNFQSMAIVPIRCGGGTLGVIHVVSDKAHRMSVDVVELLEQMGLHVGTALRRVMAESQVEKERSRLLGLLRDLPGYVALIGPDHRVRFANESFTEVFSSREGDLCYARMGRLSPCEGCEMEEIFRDKVVLGWERSARDGRVFQVRGYPFQDADGTPLLLQLGTDVTERRAMEKEIVRAAEEERRSIGSDLHDSLGQTLGGISCLVQVLRRKLERQGIVEAAEAGKIEQLVANSVALTRSLATGLNPIGLRPDGLVGAVEELASNIESIYGICCTVNSDGPVEVADGMTAVHLYRIAQEALSNAARHGKASVVSLSIRAMNGSVEMVVEDDGVGLPKDAGSGGGLGLKVMRYRAGIINSSVEFEAIPHGGTRVICRPCAGYGEKR